MTLVAAAVILGWTAFYTIEARNAHHAYEEYLRSANQEAAVRARVTVVAADAKRNVATAAFVSAAVLFVVVALAGRAKPAAADPVATVEPGGLSRAAIPHSTFISYSTKDREFAERLHADLENAGVRCWFAQKDLRIGDRFGEKIEEAISRNERLLLVLSQHSIESSWVEREVEAALEKEQKVRKKILFPIRLDEAFREAKTPWAAEIRRMRHIGDFSFWKDAENYRRSLDQLLRDLADGDRPCLAPDMETRSFRP